MLEAIQRKFALSQQGARDLVKSSLACALYDLSLMFPVGLLYQFVLDLMRQQLGAQRVRFYLLASAVCLVLIFLTGYWKFTASYIATYVESGKSRIALAEKLRLIPLSFFGKRDLSDLTSALMEDRKVLETMFSTFIPPLVGAGLSTFLVSVSLFAYDWRMALAATWVLPLALGVILASRRLQDQSQKRTLQANLALERSVQECIDCLADLKSNNAEAAYLDGLSEEIQAVEKERLRSELRVALVFSSASLLLRLGIASIALAGSALLKQQALSLPLFFLFLLVASRLYEPLSFALQNLVGILLCKTNLERMKEIMDTPLQKGTATLQNQGYELCFEDVSFAYQPGQEVLHGVSFCAKQGQVTALVGPSGSGKTTLSRLAARFWDPDSGHILLGGMDIGQVDPERLLSLYSIVFQEVTLFNNTVMENIRIGRKGATDEEVIQAAKLANCHVFIEKLADGYQTLIGENGCTLSGGERQRLSMARAFLKQAPILLLDEATASLDVENESLIQAALSRLIQDKTVLVIAHRMRTVENADRVVVLEQGRVVEQGSPDELLAKPGLFAQMLELQTRSGEWALGD